MLGIAEIGVGWAMALCLLTVSCSGASTVTATPTGSAQAAAPAITTTPALNGAVVVSLTATAPGATIYFTLDGSAPTTGSSVYEAPFLIASNLTVNAIAEVAGDVASSVASQSFRPDIPSGTLVWSDEFSNSTGENIQPNPQVWTYDTGGSGWGKGELEIYCGWNSSAPPCSNSKPNAYVGTDGALHIVAEEPSNGVYTSARLKTQGLFTFQYGRIEIRAKAPEAQGLWPAFWMMGSDYTSVHWPACGENDILERVNGAESPDWNEGSIHGSGFTGGNIGTVYKFPGGETAAGWHTYGMIWSKGKVAYYVDDPAKPYATYTPSSVAGFSGSAWPFDSGPSFLLLNLAVGGSWPGSPNAATPFPSEFLVDYVRVYTN